MNNYSNSFTNNNIDAFQGVIKAINTAININNTYKNTINNKIKD